MKLDEFIDQETKRIEAFRAFYTHQNQRDAASWPLEMPEGDWDYQLMDFNSEGTAPL